MFITPVDNYLLTKINAILDNGYNVIDMIGGAATPLDEVKNALNKVKSEVVRIYKLNSTKVGTEYNKFIEVNIDRLNANNIVQNTQNLLNIANKINDLVKGDKKINSNLIRLISEVNNKLTEYNKSLTTLPKPTIATPPVIAKPLTPPPAPPVPPPFKKPIVSSVPTKISSITPERLSGTTLKSIPKPITFADISKTLTDLMNSINFEAIRTNISSKRTVNSQINDDIRNELNKIQTDMNQINELAQKNKQLIDEINNLAK